MAKSAASYEKKIVDEIREKCEKHEADQAGWLSTIMEADDLFKVRPPARKDNTYSNPRQTEYYRAVAAVGTLMYRMMTSADPFYEARPVDLNPDYDALDTIKHTWDTQLRYAKYRPNLLRACHIAPSTGTVICQEDYRIFGVGPFGRRVPATTLTPRSLDQVFFDQGATSFDDADWVATADITSSVELKRLAQEARDLKAPWNEKALEAAADAVEDSNTIPWRVLERLKRSGFTLEDAFKKKKELLFYSGKLDCLNDGMEYIAVLVNRKYLVRFHANRNQSGRRNLRVGKWVDYDATPTGLGYIHLLGRQHKAMDANRQKAQDLFTKGAYGMMTRRRGSVLDDDLVLQPNGFVDVDDHNDLRPIDFNVGAGKDILSLDELLKQEFRGAAHAPDILQAMASEASTATEAGLSSNEALRAVACHAEMLAEPLVREHLENLHANNVQNIDAPFNINAAKITKRVYPAQLRMELDIRAKTTTDKDFSPKRLERLIQLAQILTSTKSDHADLAQISILPLVQAIAQDLQVNPNEVITMGRGGMPQGAGMDAAAMLGMTGNPGATAGALGSVSTPIGNILAVG